MAIFTISGEGSFRILGGDAMISPSNEEYELYMSPDNKTFSPTGIKCPAGEGHMIIGAARSCFWKLVGNNSELTINC